MTTENHHMTTKIGPPPTDWKSNRWWQNRSAEERIGWASLPSRWRDIAYDGIRIPGKVLSQTTTWLDEFRPGAPGVFITGPSGSAKTILAQAMLKELFLDHAISGRFVAADRYVEMIKDQFDNDNELPEMYAMPHLVKYLKGLFDVVVLDGVGQERKTEFNQHEIGSLIRRRFEDGRTTIVTTTLPVTDFVRQYGQRVAAAIEEFKVVTL